MTTSFSQAVIEKLEFYVYFLQDPRNDEIFYVGKGVGNRVFNHMECAIETNGETEKLDKIRDIVNSGNKVKHFILRHGLSESVSFEVEAAIIDFVGMENLSNLQGGHYSSDFGIKTADEISAMYEAQELNTNKPILLININKEYRRDMNDNELYDATRKSWVVGPRREIAEYAVATYRGLTREIYKINDWYPIDRRDKQRWGFNGIKANENIRKELRYKSIGSFFKKGAANPIKYVNCQQIIPEYTAEEVNIVAEEVNIVAEEVNIVAEEVNIVAEEVNIVAEEVNIVAEEVNIADEEVNIADDVILITINKLYHSKISEQELYEATKGVWRIGDRKIKAKYAFAVFQGVVREVYTINKWHKAGTLPYLYREIDKDKHSNRWEFEGIVANQETREKYLKKSIKQYLSKGNQNPIRYVNC